MLRHHTGETKELIHQKDAAMPIINMTKGTNLTPKVSIASNVLARSAGLLGTATPDPNKALYLVPCKAVHTFGMKYSLDVVFLDIQGKVVKLLQNLAPNKMTSLVPAANCVLELPPNTIAATRLEVGDELYVTVDEKAPASFEGVKRLLHWPANLLMALLWIEFVLSSFMGWQQHGSVLSLGLLLVNTLLVCLFFTRRESADISRRPLDWLIAIGTVGLSMALRSHPAENGALTLISVTLQLIGIVMILGSLSSLGRSFGIVPANRKVQSNGAYQIVRHPLYASEMLFYFGFFLGNFSVFNLFAVVAILAGQIWRAVSEEKLLSKDEKYVEYMRAVPYRFVPAIF